MRFVNKKSNIEYLIVASFSKEYKTLDFYAQRWQIETMFRAFKTAGFNMEDTHLTDYKRLDKLLILIALAFVWAYKVGIFRNDTLKILKVKNTVD